MIQSDQERLYGEIPGGDAKKRIPRLPDNSIVGKDGLWERHDHQATHHSS
jgi:hypothetical protein